VATHQALACIVFRKICLYEGNGFVLFEDIGLTSTLKRILQDLQRFDSSNTKRFLTQGSVATTIDAVENVEDVIAIAIVREVKRPPTCGK
jgi:hypothetical protein